VGHWQKSQTRRTTAANYEPTNSRRGSYEILRKAINSHLKHAELCIHNGGGNFEE
jgi:hypothetical protein